MAAVGMVEAVDHEGVGRAGVPGWRAHQDLREALSVPACPCRWKTWCARAIVQPAMHDEPAANRDLVLRQVRTGSGNGLVCHGECWRGGNNIAWRELGHVPTALDGLCAVLWCLGVLGSPYLQLCDARGATFWMR